MSSSQFKKIWLIESVPDGELRVAFKLLEGSIQAAQIRDENLDSELISTPNKKSFFAALKRIRDETQAGNYPLIHFDCHGCKDGFELADKSIVSWDELRIPLIQINIRCRLNLFIAVSACDGIYFSFTANKLDRAPFWGALAPIGSVAAGDLIVDFDRFYTKLFNSLQLEEAIQFINSKENHYIYTSAGRVFVMGWEGYLRQHGSSKARLERMESLLTRAFSLTDRNPAHLKKMRSVGKAMLRDPRPAFDRVQHRFFMKDLFYENSHRFNLTYNEFIEIISP